MSAEEIDRIRITLNALDSLGRVMLKKRKKLQVDTADERKALRETAGGWVSSTKPALLQVVEASHLEKVDGLYQQLLDSADRRPTRTTILSLIKSIKAALIELRTQISKLDIEQAKRGTNPAPDFSALVRDKEMQAILTRRWDEAQICVLAPAPMAATVMMGGLLEALLLARVNRETDKRHIFQATASPKGKDKAPLGLKDWTLQHYLDVAHELKWITQSAKDIGVVLRDYRNYIHPAKEYSHKVILSPNDAEMLWTVARGICRQLV